MACVTSYSPAPVHWCRDAELTVLLFPHCASKSALHLDSESFLHTHGCLNCKMCGQEGSWWCTNHMGIAPSEVFSYCKGTFQYFSHFISSCVLDLKNALRCWEMFWYMNLWKKRKYFVFIGCFVSSWTAWGLDSKELLVTHTCAKKNNNEIKHCDNWVDFYS